MAYKIDEIEGIGAKYAERLQTAGIKTTDDLLKACGSRKGRDDTAEQTGFSTSQLLRWANVAEVNDAKKLTRALPAASHVQKWVDQAKTMDAAISH